MWFVCYQLSNVVNVAVVVVCFVSIVSCSTAKASRRDVGTTGPTAERGGRQNHVGEGGKRASKSTLPL